MSQPLPGSWVLTHSLRLYTSFRSVVPGGRGGGGGGRGAGDGEEAAAGARAGGPLPPVPPLLGEGAAPGPPLLPGPGAGGTAAGAGLGLPLLGLLPLAGDGEGTGPEDTSSEAGTLAAGGVRSGRAEREAGRSRWLVDTDAAGEAAGTAGHARTVVLHLQECSPRLCFCCCRPRHCEANKRLGIRWIKNIQIDNAL